jgi:hypothetical protein
MLGAVTVAAWYLILDVGSGHPLRTPSLLGQIVLFGNLDPVTDRIVAAAVAGYTVVHCLLFIGLGILITKITYLAQNNPVFLFAGFMLFVVFEVFFTLFTYVFHAASNGLFPWTTTLTANSLAALVMTLYIWRHNPALKRALQRHALGE